MSDALGLLEQRVAAAVDLITNLRDRVSQLESEIASLRARCTEMPPQGPPPCDPSLLDELSRLRAERGLVRERIHELIADFDRVAW